MEADASGKRVHFALCDSPIILFERLSWQEIRGDTSATVRGCVTDDPDFGVIAQARTRRLGGFAEEFTLRKTLALWATAVHHGGDHCEPTASASFVVTLPGFDDNGAEAPSCSDSTGSSPDEWTDSEDGSPEVRIQVVSAADDLPSPRMANYCFSTSEGEPQFGDWPDTDSEFGDDSDSADPVGPRIEVWSATSSSSASEQSPIAEGCATFSVPPPKMSNCVVSSRADPVPSGEWPDTDSDFGENKEPEPEMNLACGPAPLCDSDLSVADTKIGSFTPDLVCDPFSENRFFARGDLEPIVPPLSGAPIALRSPREPAIVDRARTGKIRNGRKPSGRVPGTANLMVRRLVVLPTFWGPRWSFIWASAPNWMPCMPIARVLGANREQASIAAR